VKGYLDERDTRERRERCRVTREMKRGPQLTHLRSLSAPFLPLFYTCFERQMGSNLPTRWLRDYVGPSVSCSPFHLPFPNPNPLSLSSLPLLLCTSFVSQTYSFRLAVFSCEAFQVRRNGRFGEEQDLSSRSSDGVVEGSFAFALDSREGGETRGLE